MFYGFEDSSIRYTGRWAVVGENCSATAPGSTIEIAYRGKRAVLRFDTEWNDHPYPHLWIQVDGGAKIETVVCPYLQVESMEEGSHVIKIIFKGAVEQHHRWYAPLIGKVSFLGYEAEERGTLPEDTRKTIEFVGDSITEGILIDADYQVYQNEQHNRVFEDDVTAGYAYLTAQKLGLRPIFMGYGAVGVTRPGCGSVPKAALAYPYCFDGHPIPYESADYILINHGANDGGSSAEVYLKEYEGLLNVVRKRNPNSQIIVVNAFCGVFADELEAFVARYNEEKGEHILFISSKGWVPKEPLHPLRDGHQIIAEKLTGKLKEYLGL